ncbi:uncharacterized protein EI97DRAFT_440629 [Westerdykella ornata]|uniref:Uncharacterized protein n=1 Tax=Westerdykella ornata TaxID=318751 RepID=A0A6A6JNA6_WESOR|nr:uncharacterized protein EI97DRAFT_440629 [Westerdykella ornata]KAF2278110.1 hypothetical protein EI97DRAFT_440629 [Westerdykella ornata]
MVWDFLHGTSTNPYTRYARKECDLILLPSFLRSYKFKGLTWWGNCNSREMDIMPSLFQKHEWGEASGNTQADMFPGISPETSRRQTIVPKSTFDRPGPHPHETAGPADLPKARGIRMCACATAVNVLPIAICATFNNMAAPPSTSVSLITKSTYAVSYVFRFSLLRLKFSTFGPMITVKKNDMLCEYLESIFETPSLPL